MTTQSYQPGLSDKKKLEITSLAASALSGFFGTAGALFFNWMVQWWLGRDMKRANGLSLLAISVTVAIGIVIRIFWPIQIIRADWHKVQILLIAVAFGVIGVIFGKLYEKRLKEAHLRQMFIGILLLTSFKLLGFIPAQLFSSLPVDARTATALWSLVAGIGTPLLGAGGGFFLIPAFLGIGFSRDEAILMSLIVTGFLVLFGAWLFHRAGRLEIKDLRHVWLPATIGTPVGVWLSYQVSPEYFQSLFGILLIIAAGKTLHDISTGFRQLIRGIFSFRTRREHVVS
ncbi:MAG: sulfite exporter TauE/SafE family protein [Candidatus Sungbacteria bacterium]|nr:sulfite exporter TauE/SafE family protein [Candidatus Sungbacteria bacterium]